MPPAPDMDEKKIDMRHSKIKAEEAALLAGELKKPSWQSKNEGIHEKVSFEDSIWGFDLAGGSYYKTPLRVVNVSWFKLKLLCLILNTYRKKDIHYCYRFNT